MTRSEHQARFAVHAAMLILFAQSTGTMRLRRLNGMRSDEEQARLLATGKSRITRSLHQDGLAIDAALDLLVAGRWRYQADSAAYAQLGAFWESLSPLNVWGGNFPKYFGGNFVDGNHFERRLGGRPPVSTETLQA